MARFTRWLGALALVLALVVLVVDAAEGGKRRRRKRRVNDDAFEFSGTTPSGSTKWTQEAPGVISTTVDTSHLKFDRVPKYFASVSMDSRRAFAGVNATVKDLLAASPLVNVTGKTTIVKPTTNGFKIRLRYKPEMEKKLSESVARMGGWRVRWIAITGQHSLVESARDDVHNEKYDSGIDEKPVGQQLAYVKMLEALAKEVPTFTRNILATDFALPLSQRPKPKPKKKKEEKSETKTESEDVNASAEAEETPDQESEPESSSMPDENGMEDNVASE